MVEIRPPNKYRERVSTLSAKPGKSEILSFTLPGLENAWNLFKKCFKIHFLRFHLQINSDLHVCHIYITNPNTDLKPN